VRLLEGKCGGATIGVEYENTDAQRGRGRFGIYTFSIPFPTEAARLISDRLVGRVMAFVTKKSTLRPPPVSDTTHHSFPNFAAFG